MVFWAGTDKLSGIFVKNSTAESSAGAEESSGSSTGVSGDSSSPAETSTEDALSPIKESSSEKSGKKSRRTVSSRKTSPRQSFLSKGSSPQAAKPKPSRLTKLRDVVRGPRKNKAKDYKPDPLSTGPLSSQIECSQIESSDSGSKNIYPAIYPALAANTAIAGGQFSEAQDVHSDSKIVSARGTENGLVLRLDGRAAWAELIADIKLFLDSRKHFFQGGHVSLEWLERLPAAEQSRELEALLRETYQIEIATKRRKPELHSRRHVAQGGELNDRDTEHFFEGNLLVDKNLAGRSYGGVNQHPANAKNYKAMNYKDSILSELVTSETVPPAAGSSGQGDFSSVRSGNVFQEYSGRGDSSLPNLERLIASHEVDALQASNGDDFSSSSSVLVGDRLVGDSQSSKRQVSRMARMLGDDMFYEDDANAKIFFGTVRSGQRLETPFSLVVVGDVNPGADLVAGGDIVVLGSLRGTAHASAYDDEAYEGVIVALQMQPMQLRIGSIISRGSDECVRGAEIARIENRRIVVEAYNPRAIQSRKLK